MSTLLMFNSRLLCKESIRQEINDDEVSFTETSFYCHLVFDEHRLVSIFKSIFTNRNIGNK